MQRRTITMILICAVFGLFVTAPLSGFAATSWHGSDYTTEYNYGVGQSNTLYACDMESDGNPAGGEYITSDGGSGYVSDSNGSASGCGAAYNWYLFTKHRACEQRWYLSCNESWTTHSTP